MSEEAATHLYTPLSVRGSHPVTRDPGGQSSATTLHHEICAPGAGVVNDSNRFQL